MARDFPKINYTSCMGTLINYYDKNILIDCINSPDVLPYQSVKKETLLDIVKKNQPFSKIDMMLITHEHREHFQPDLTCQIMAACPEATLIAPVAVTNQLRQSKYFKKRFITQIISVDLDLNKSIEFTLKGITIRAAHIMHDEPEKHSDIQNVAFLLNMGEHRILHVGDAIPDFAQLEQSGLASAGVSCAIVPYKYLITEKGIDALVNLSPRYMIATHFPVKEYDNTRIYDKAMQIKNSPNSPFPKLTYFLSEIMPEVVLR